MIIDSVQRKLKSRIVRETLWSLSALLGRMSESVSVSRGPYSTDNG